MTNFLRRYIEVFFLKTNRIICDASIPGIYTNRALVRLKMERFDDVILDCEKALSLKNKQPLIESQSLSLLMDDRC